MLEKEIFIATNDAEFPQNWLEIYPYLFNYLKHRYTYFPKKI